MKKIIEKNKGFTLIELLVVISIIALLSAVVLSNLSNARTKAKFSKAFSTMTALNKIAYMCTDAGSTINPPTSNITGGGLVCSGQTMVYPNISDTNFVYCGTSPTSCGGWTSSGYSYAFSIYSDSFSGGRKIVVCGSDINVSGWFYSGSSFNFTSGNFCKKDGF